MADTIGWMLGAALAAGLGLSSGWAAAPVPAPGAPARGAAPQIEGATLVSRDPVETSRYLGASYRKEADGYRLTPPAGATFIERNGVDLVSFVVKSKSWGGALQRVTATDKVTSLEEFVVNHRKEIVADWSFKAVQFLEEKRITKDKFPAVRLTFSMEATPVAEPGKPGVPIALLKQELIVQTKDRQYMMLTLYSPLRDNEEAKRTFDLMIPELELFDASQREKRVAAVILGKSWIAQQSAEQFRAKIINQPQYYRMLVGGQDVGYMRFDELTREVNPKGGGLIDVERDGHKGLILLATFCSFPNGSAVISGQNEAFWGYSKDARGQDVADYSNWHNISKISVPPTQARPGQPSVRTVTNWLEEIGILRQSDLATKLGKPYHINVTLNGDDSQQLVSNEQQIVPLGPATQARVIPKAMPGFDLEIPLEGASPLPKILEYSWTRFVDLTKPSEMTFFVFDSSAKGRALRNLIVTGTKENVTIDGKVVTCYKCVDELDPNSTTIWTDKDGRIEMMRTSDQSVMVPTTEAAMLTKWAKRLGDL